MSCSQGGKGLPSLFKNSPESWGLRFCKRRIIGLTLSATSIWAEGPPISNGTVSWQLGCNDASAVALCLRRHTHLFLPIQAKVQQRLHLGFPWPFCTSGRGVSPMACPSRVHQDLTSIFRAHLLTEYAPALAPRSIPMLPAPLDMFATTGLGDFMRNR